MFTAATSSTVTPTVTIKTYSSVGNIVDQAINVPFNTTTIANTNLATLTSFTITNPQISPKTKIMKGYFGNLLLNFQPSKVSTISGSSYIVITMTSDFYPYSNIINLPMICLLNNVRLPCTYSLNPFIVTISSVTNNFVISSNLINITT
jgi:hypothetical protein